MVDPITQTEEAFALGICLQSVHVVMPHDYYVGAGGPLLLHITHQAVEFIVLPAVIGIILSAEPGGILGQGDPQIGVEPAV